MRPLLGAILSCLLMAQTSSEAKRPPVGGEASPPTLSLLSERPLPDRLAEPRDVRWLGEDSLLLSTQPDGLVRVSLAGRGWDREVLIPASSGLHGIWRAQEVARSISHVATSAPVFSLAWRPRNGDRQPTVHPFAAVVDFDLWRDRILILGGRRDDAGTWCPEGAIAWRGRLGGGLLDSLHSVYFSRDGEQAQNMGRCGVLGLGAVRFLDDGSFVVAPGVEEGVYLYNPDGELVTPIWDSDPAGFFTGCPLSDEEARRLHADERRRYQWLDRRPLLEDIVALGDDPALVVRTVLSGTTRWELVVLRRDGEMDRFSLPFSSTRSFAHVRGDVRDEQMVFVMFGGMDYEDPDAERKLLFVEAPL